MSTKTQLIADVNAQVTAVVGTVKHRESMLLVIDELYTNVITDNSTSETYTEQTNANIAYTINIVKTGTNIRIDGSYQNQLTIALPSNSVIYTQKDNQFKGILDSVQSLGLNANYLDGVLYTIAPLAPDEQKQFSITYTAKD